MPSNTPPIDAPVAANVVTLEIGARRRPGRPRSIRRAPDAQEREQHRRVEERLQHHVEADPVVQVTRQRADRTSTAAIDAAMIALAREAAGLGWERLQAQTRGGRDAEKISSRRIDALGKLAGLVLERARLGPNEFDHTSPKFMKLVGLFLEQMRECAVETLGADVAGEFCSEFEARMAGWESRLG